MSPNKQGKRTICLQHPTGSHTGADCRQNPRNAGKTGSKGTNSRTNNSKNANSEINNKKTNNKNSVNNTFQDQMTGMEYSGRGPKPSLQKQKLAYCEACNLPNHYFNDCPNSFAIVEYHRSKLLCAACGVKGHLKNECRNLNVVCPKCKQPGHGYFECDFTPNQAQLAQQKSQCDFVSDLRQLTTVAQKMRRQWKEYQAEAERKGEFIPESVRIPSEDAILCAERDPARYAHLFESGPAPAQVVPSATVTQPAPAVPCNHNHAAPATQTPDEAVVVKMRREGVSDRDIAAFQAFVHQKQHEEQSRTHAAINAKINASKHAYPAQHVNNTLLQNERLIVEQQYLSQQRMDEVKNGMLNYAQFFRDPEAIKALFNRLRPCCMGCHQQGVIFNRHFNEVPLSATLEEIYNLEDAAVWGLFVGFQCRCSAIRVAGKLVANFDYAVPQPTTVWNSVAR